MTAIELPAAETRTAKRILDFLDPGKRPSSTIAQAVVSSILSGN